MEIVIALVVVVALLALRESARAAVTVCVVDVRDGKVRVVRGGIAPRVLADIEDVVGRPKIRRATLRIVRSGAHARLEVKGGVDEMQRQRLRNVVGTVPLAKLGNTRRR